MRVISENPLRSQSVADWQRLISRTALTDTACPHQLNIRTATDDGCGIILTRFTPVPRTRSVLVCERDAKRLVNALKDGILSLIKDSDNDSGWVSMARDSITFGDIFGEEDSAVAGGEWRKGGGL